MHENQCHDQSSFVTLTYANAPEKLSKPDLQLFIKRLREHAPVPIRYFACGEYGTLTRRPHYHLLLYGTDFLNTRTYAIDEELYGSPLLDKAWGHGIASIGRVTPQSIAYVCGYVSKKIGDPDTFNLMSTRPGIGHNWLKRHKDNLRRNGHTTLDGRELPIPRKYLEWESTYLQQLIKERTEWHKNRTPDEKLYARTHAKMREINYQSRIDRMNSTI